MIPEKQHFLLEHHSAKKHVITHFLAQNQHKTRIIDSENKKHPLGALL